jgi:dipeptidyl aminopeptidase/acylaminoacyl peptidase
MISQFVTIVSRKRISIIATGFVLLVLGVYYSFLYEPYSRTPDDPLYREILGEFFSAQPIAVNVSPNGEYVLTKEELPSGGFQIAVQDWKSSRVLYTNFSKNSQRSLTWRPDSQAIVFQETDGMDRPLYLWDLQSGRTTKLDAPVSQTALPPLRWDPSGKKLAYFHGDSSTGRLLVIEPDAKEPPVVITHSMSGTCSFVWSADGLRLALFTGSEPGTVTIAELNPLRLSEIQLGGDAKMQDLAWSPDAKSILVAARREDDEYFKLFQIEPDNEISLKAEADGDIGNPVWLPDGKSFLYHVLSDGIIHAVVSNRESGSRKAIGPTNGVFRVTHTSSDGETLYARFASLTAPPALVAVSVKTEQSRSVYMPPNSREVECPQPKSIRIPAEGGTLVPAYHWSARNGTNPLSGVLIEVHGGTHTQTYPTWESYVQVMTRRGCDVIALNYRGSSGFGQTFENLDTDDARVLDVIAARDYAVEKLNVAPEKVFLMGNSNGSRLVAAAATQREHIGGIVLISWVGPIQGYEIPITKPILILAFQGELDSILPPREARESVQKFVAAGKTPGQEVRWRTYKDEGHFFYKTESRAIICWELLTNLAENKAR